MRTKWFASLESFDSQSCVPDLDESPLVVSLIAGYPGCQETNMVFKSLISLIAKVQFRGMTHDKQVVNYLLLSVLYVTQCLLKQTNHQMELAMLVDQLLFDEQEALDNVQLATLLKISDIWQNDPEVYRVCQEPAKIFSQYIHDCNENLMHYWLSNLLPRFISHMEMGHSLATFEYSQQDYVYSNFRYDRTKLSFTMKVMLDEEVELSYIDKPLDDLTECESTCIFVVDMAVYTRSEARSKLDLQHIVTHMNQIYAARHPRKKRTYVLLANMDHFHTMLEEYSLYRSPAAMMVPPPPGIDFRMPSFKYKLRHMHNPRFAYDTSPPIPRLGTHFSKLSQGSLENVCRFLFNPRDLVRFGAVNQLSRSAASNNEIWRNLTLTYRGYTISESDVDNLYSQSKLSSWKRFFMEKTLEVHREAAEFMKSVILQDNKSADHVSFFPVNTLDQPSIKKLLDKILVEEIRSK